jgi:hypothetical protein
MNILADDVEMLFSQVEFVYEVCGEGWSIR